MSIYANRLKGVVDKTKFFIYLRKKGEMLEIANEGGSDM